MDIEIQKGDQYSIPLALKFNGEDVTPQTVDDVRVQIGGILLAYVGGSLTYDSESKVWFFPLTEEQTRDMPPVVCFQCAVKQGHDLYYSDISYIPFGDSIIKETWDA